jgi:hypothetical protein
VESNAVEAVAEESVEVVPSQQAETSASVAIEQN